MPTESDPLGPESPGAETDSSLSPEATVDPSPTSSAKSESEPAGAEPPESATVQISPDSLEPDPKSDIDTSEPEPDSDSATLESEAENAEPMAAESLPDVESGDPEAEAEPVDMPEPARVSSDLTTVPTSTLERVLQVFDQLWTLAQPVTQPVGQILSQLLGAGWNQLQQRTSQSKLYANNKALIDKGGQGVQWIWRKLVQPVWGQGIELLRSRLPAPLSSRLSNRGLTGLILGLVLVLWWLVSLLSPHPAPAQAPVPSAPMPVPPPPEVTTPTPVVSKPPLSEITPTLEPEPTITPEPRSEPTEVVTPTPAFTLAPSKIMDVQAQVAAITQQHSQDMIEAVQANFQDNQLVVQLSDRWYNLSASKQNQLGKDVLRRSQQLDLEQLEFRDHQGALVARNPVIGSNIIILQRHATDPDAD